MKNHWLRKNDQKIKAEEKGCWEISEGVQIVDCSISNLGIARTGEIKGLYSEEIVISGNVTFKGDVTIIGNLNVEGDLTIGNSMECVAVEPEQDTSIHCIQEMSDKIVQDIHVQEWNKFLDVVSREVED
jgi:hypothetical protein